MSTWLITGCSTGLGRALAETVIGAGHNAVVSARNVAKVADLADIAPDRVLAVALDVTDPQQVASAAQQAEDRFGGVDVLVNLPPSQEVLGLSAEPFWEILRGRVRPSHLVEGNTFNFGKDRGGNVQRLAGWCAAAGVRLHVVELRKHDPHGQRMAPNPLEELAVRPRRTARGRRSTAGRRPARHGAWPRKRHTVDCRPCPCRDRALTVTIA